MTHVCFSDSLTNGRALAPSTRLVHVDATARLSDQVDGQLRTINELNNIVSDHERTICESAQS